MPRAHASRVRSRARTWAASSRSCAGWSGLTTCSCTITSTGSTLSSPSLTATDAAPTRAFTPFSRLPVDELGHMAPAVRIEHTYPEDERRRDFGAAHEGRINERPLDQLHRRGVASCNHRTASVTPALRAWVCALHT